MVNVVDITLVKRQGLSKEFPGNHQGYRVHRLMLLFVTDSCTCFVTAENFCIVSGFIKS